MARFNQIAIGEIFFDCDTGEYYIKKSEKSAWIYVVDDDCELRDNDGQPVQCEFPPNHQVEDI